MLPRKIVHIDMDAFYASVEQRYDPQLRGKPVVVAWRGNRSVVCAASYEARKFGVHSAMPAIRAERLCPNAVFLPPDFPRYRAASRQVREILQCHTDLVEPLSLDEAYLDVSENKTGLRTATLVARTIREQIRTELQLTASAGVAPNKLSVRDCLSMVTDSGEAFLEHTPVRVEESSAACGRPKFCASANVQPSLHDPRLDWKERHSSFGDLPEFFIIPMRAHDSTRRMRSRSQ